MQIFANGPNTNLQREEEGDEEEEEEQEEEEEEEEEPEFDSSGDEIDIPLMYVKILASQLSQLCAQTWHIFAYYPRTDLSLFSDPHCHYPKNDAVLARCV